jgi:hypothetical protein
MKLVDISGIKRGRCVQLKDIINKLETNKKNKITDLQKIMHEFKKGYQL